MEEIEKHGRIGLAAMRAGMDRKTARKYVRTGKLPSELRKPHIWRTREDPFAEDWATLVEMLEEAPELEATRLFDHLSGLKPEAHTAGQLRTLQRRIREWRAQRGPEREIFFPQAHRPGEAIQTDFTHATVLGVTICGESFDHQLCHSVLPFSNWEWATVCHSESMAALRRGVQSTLFRLGRVPEFHQTDNSTAATHDLRTGKRGFNEEYLAMMGHFGVKPRTIGVGEKEQNGDIEASHGVLKRRLAQHLLLRGNRDFESEEVYERWLWEKIEAANRLRQAKLAEELAVLAPVCGGSGVRIKVLFPSLTFRRAYDALTERLDAWKADIEYLRILHLAASTMESEVETALELVMDAGECPVADAVKRVVAPEKIEVPALEVPTVDLTSYDSLLVGDAGACP